MRMQRTSAQIVSLGVDGAAAVAHRTQRVRLLGNEDALNHIGRLPQRLETCGLLDRRLDGARQASFDRICDLVA